MSCAMCRDCKMCLESCPQNAISRVEKEGDTFEYVCDAKKCIGCGICIPQCPTEAIQLVAKGGSEKYVPPRFTYQAYLRMAKERGKI